MTEKEKIIELIEQLREIDKYDLIEAEKQLYLQKNSGRRTGILKSIDADLSIQIRDYHTRIITFNELLGMLRSNQPLENFIDD